MDLGIVYIFTGPIQKASFMSLRAENLREVSVPAVFVLTDVYFCSLCVSIAYSTPGATAPNRFVGIGSRDNNFLNIPQQTQVRVWLMLE